MAQRSSDPQPRPSEGPNPNQLRVSVVIPARNAAGLIESCLQALRNQTLPAEAYEVIVVDDASTDQTAQIARRLGAQVIVLPSRGGSYTARNRGAELARAPLLAFTDADCSPEPDWLAEGLRPFDDPAVGCVCGVVRGHAPGTTWVERRQLDLETLSERGSLEHPFLPYAQTANAFYSKAAWSELGGFADRWISGGDADMSWRMSSETDYRLVAASAAVVRHRHRKTVAAMCRQSYRHGLGHAALYRRYRPRLQGVSLLATLRDALRALAAVPYRLVLPRSAPSRSVRSRSVRSRWESAGYAWLDLLQIVSRAAGFFAGRFRPDRTRTRDPGDRA